MKATVVDLRYKMNDILKALDRNETVTVLYHGKEKGVIMPIQSGLSKKVENHPFFGMLAKENQQSVLDDLNDLRKPRYDDL